VQSDSLILGGKEFQSRFILGSGKYSHELIDSAINEAGAQILTLALRRINESKERNILDFIPKGVTLLPNTSGARNAKEAVRIAQLARELGCGVPDNIETIKACEALANDGFVPMPYMFPDLNAARAMLSAGASCIMPLAAPIGSNQGLVFKDIIEILINELDTQIIVDAGIGRPSQACEAMEMGAAAIMANTAIASSKNIQLMARAFKEAIIAGRNAYLAGLGAKSKSANASSPLTGFLD